MMHIAIQNSVCNLILFLFYLLLILNSLFDLYFMKCLVIKFKHNYHYFEEEITDLINNIDENDLNNLELNFVNIMNY